MKKLQLHIAITILLVGSNLFADEMKLTEFYRPANVVQFNYGIGTLFIPIAENDSDFHRAMHKVGAAYEFQGNGRIGFQIPFEYYFPQNDLDVHLYTFGANLVYHLTDRSKKIDPYLLVGAKMAGGSEHGNHAVAPFLLLHVGGGVRYYMTKHFGLFAEVGATSIFVATELAGKFGLTFAF